jgi:hypothetical protein
MSFSRYLQREILDHILTAGTYARPTIYVALFSSDPGETLTGTELSGVNYARVACPNWNAATDASPAVCTNASIIQFATPGVGGWGTATYFALFDSISGGTNLLGSGMLTLSKVINEGDSVSFAIGVCQVSLT